MLEVENVSAGYGLVQILWDVSFRIREKEIVSIIGPNGAGKTTTIRALLGMIRPTSGSVRVLGHAVGPNGNGPWQRVGHLVEEPAAYPDLTVRENLEIARRLQGVTNKSATSRVIERLSLSPYADRKAGLLSTGNFQRLALARAFLHAPELLILDEPAKGLDPAGVVEIRELLASLAQESRVTVFMSSHILTEVDRLATRIGIIHKGRLVEELEADTLEKLRSLRLEIEVRDLQSAQSALTKAGFAVRLGESTIVLNEARAIDSPDEVATILVNAGTPPIRMAVEQEDLEDHFLRLTGYKE